ncbi:11039_t:CDS:2, partial [Ambispora gerdemannii]
ELSGHGGDYNADYVVNIGKIAARNSRIAPKMLEIRVVLSWWWNINTSTLAELAHQCTESQHFTRSKTTIALSPFIDLYFALSDQSEC